MFMKIVPGVPENAQPLSGAVTMTLTFWSVSSSTRIGRVGQSPTVYAVVAFQLEDAGTKVRSATCGRPGVVETSLRLVLTTAKTRPAASDCSDFRLTWSSA